MEILEPSHSVDESGPLCQPAESTSTTFTSLPSAASLTEVNLDFPNKNDYNKKPETEDFKQCNAKTKRVISSFAKMILNSMGVSDECCSSEHIIEYMDCLEPKALESFYEACKVYFDPKNKNSGVGTLKTINHVSENISSIYSQLTKLQSSIQAVAPKFNSVTNCESEDFESQLSNFIMGDLLYKTEKCALELSKMLLVSPFIPPMPQNSNEVFQIETEGHDQMKRESGKALNTQDIHMIISECMKSFQYELRCAMAEIGKSPSTNAYMKVKTISSPKVSAEVDYCSQKLGSNNPVSSTKNNASVNSPKSVISAVSTPKKSQETVPIIDMTKCTEIIQGKSAESNQIASEVSKSGEGNMVETVKEKYTPQSPVPRAMLVKGIAAEDCDKAGYPTLQSKEVKDSADSQKVIYRNVYYDPNSLKIDDVICKTQTPDLARAQNFFSQNAMVANPMGGSEAFNPNVSAVDQSWASIKSFNEKLAEASKAKLASFPRQQTFQGNNYPSNNAAELSKFGSPMPKMESATKMSMAQQIVNSNAGQTRIRVKNFSEIPAPVKLPQYIQHMKVIQDPTFAFNPSSQTPGYPGAFVDMQQLPNMNFQDMSRQQLSPNPIMNAFVATPQCYNGNAPQINSVQGNPVNSSLPSWLPQNFNQNQLPIPLNQEQVMQMQMQMPMPYPPINRTEAQIFCPGQNKQTAVSRTPSADLWVPRWRANRAATSDVPNEFNDTFNDKASLKSEGQPVNPNSRKPKMSSPALCGIMGF